MIPQLVDHKGEFLSYDVTHSSAVHHLTAHTTRSKRWAKQLNKKSLKSSNKTNFFLDGDKQKGRSSVFYKLSAYGKVFHLNLTLNTQLLSNDFAVEFINNTNRRKSLDELWDCHYTGVSVNGDASDAAISNCNGLHGVFSTESDDYFVEPLWNHTNVVGVDGHPHVVYSRSSLKYGDLSRYCGVTDYKRKKYVKWYRKRPGYLNDILKPKNQSPFWKWRPKRNDGNITSSSKPAKRRSRRSRSFESHIETLVVVDKKMLDYHVTSDTEDNRKALTAYVLTIMNIVAKLFHNPTIGNAINIIVTRIFYLEAEKGDNLPQINYHADMSLDSFCKWQNNFTSNMGNNSDSGFNHDNAVLITRYDICTYKNDPCGTLGLAPVEGMCEKERSCSINQDIGLASAFTIAHEIGHNLGMQHDGDGNQCGMPGREPARLMAARLSKETSPFHCSGQGWCLRNVPLKREVYPIGLPGDTYDVNAQCRFQFGAKSKACKLKQACQELWCINESDACVTNSIPAAEGSECQMSRLKKGVSYFGVKLNAIFVSYRGSGTLDTRFTQWTAAGGSGPCPPGSIDFRQVQCSNFNNITFRGGLYNWVPYSGEQAKPCSLVCMAEGYNFYTERTPKVKDGTRCFLDQPNVCINGDCHDVGCDGYLGSKVKEDVCRVCQGDNSTCRTISGLFDKPLPTGAYQEIVTIPKGAMHIKVIEAKHSKNYLALKDTRDHYYINGEWTIDWPRQFSLAGTIFHYKLHEHEPESLTALGPTSEDLNIMMLLQEENKGIQYQYNIPINISDEIQHDISHYTWAHSQWSSCTKSCSKDGRIIDDKFCERQPKPVDHVKTCNENLCPPKWTLGQWSDCSQTCGEGHRTRKVACRQALGDDDISVLDDSECTEPKPASARECRLEECPPEWHTFEWSEYVKIKFRVAYCTLDAKIALLFTYIFSEYCACENHALILELQAMEQKEEERILPLEAMIGS
ncbi:A disintegrin and metalloproteinase with thrombospondin motifs 6 [Bulinus truncatus]|nr:A disintegrin and metalloproteinase with thrombospondin motifs 6 [Bulinus truncatus]